MGQSKSEVKGSAPLPRSPPPSLNNAALKQEVRVLVHMLSSLQDCAEFLIAKPGTSGTFCFTRKVTLAKQTEAAMQRLQSALSFESFEQHLRTSTHLDQVSASSLLDARRNKAECPKREVHKNMPHVRFVFFDENDESITTLMWWKQEMGKRKDLSDFNWGSICDG